MEMIECVQGLEVKLNRSLVVLSCEIDGLKEPLSDILQDIDKERELMSMELERTQHANRQLVLQHCQRPNMFTPEPNMSPRRGTLRKQLKDYFDQNKTQMQ